MYDSLENMIIIYNILGKVIKMIMFKDNMYLWMCKNMHYSLNENKFRKWKIIVFICSQIYFVHINFWLKTSLKNQLSKLIIQPAQYLKQNKQKDNTKAERNTNKMQFAYQFPHQLYRRPSSWTFGDVDKRFDERIEE